MSVFDSGDWVAHDSDTAAKLKVWSDLSLVKIVHVRMSQILSGAEL